MRPERQREKMSYYSSAGSYAASKPAITSSAYSRPTTTATASSYARPAVTTTSTASAYARPTVTTSSYATPSQGSNVAYSRGGTAATSSYATPSYGTSSTSYGRRDETSSYPPQDDAQTAVRHLSSTQLQAAPVSYTHLTLPTICSV